MLDSSLLKTRLFELYVRNVSANLLGFFIIILLNFFTPLKFFKIQRAFILEGGWIVILSFYPLVIGLGIFLQYLVQRPIAAMLKRLRRGEEIEIDFRESAQRRLLNLPFTIGLVNFAMWIGLTTMLGIIFLIFRNPPIRIGLFVGFRGFMIGYIAAILSFFLVEVFVRRRLVRILFPQGQLAAVPRTIKISILRRIRVLYGVGTLAPMFILVGTLSFVLWEMRNDIISAEQFGRELLVFTLILCIIFIIIGGRLNVLSGKSIIQPVTDMMVLVRRVRKGLFRQKVRVVSNDELGVLGDGLNEMTEGLIERDRIRQSLVLAKDVQQTLLPQTSPKVKGLDIAATIVYCEETGGDYYDFLDTDETHHGNFSVVIGDVSGHGLPSALLMATGRAFLRQRSALPGNLSDIVSDVNHQLARDIEESGGFMTLFYLAIDPTRSRLSWVRAGHDPAIVYDPQSNQFEEPTRSRLSWVRAGHDPAIVYDPQSNQFEELRGSGTALGANAEGRYQEFQKTGLRKGQIIALGSDGLWEARNSRGEMFGKEPICQIIRQAPHVTAKEILASCFNALNIFLQDRAPEDDVTLVVVKITPH
jgi:sigma-B regulation protein RsbU (phosphoserine phosphatase)